MINKKLISIVIGISIMVTGCSSTTKQYDSTASTQSNQVQDVANVQRNTENTSINGNNSSAISYYFSDAHQQPDKQLINTINSANKTLDIAIYSLTKKDIVDAVIQAKERNVDVRLLTDKTEAKTKSQKAELQLLKNNGIPIKINTHSGLLHDKFTVVDSQIIATGSFNYSNNAVYDNDENLIIIRDASVAQGYDNEFNNMWNNNSRFTNY
jgi:phosphatidylserine/phosphatidylglycerophosphate/cardiolipin synthase-like enzyme